MSVRPFVCFSNDVHRSMMIRKQRERETCRGTRDIANSIFVFLSFDECVNACVRAGTYVRQFVCFVLLNIIQGQYPLNLSAINAINDGGKRKEKKEFWVRSKIFLLIKRKVIRSAVSSGKFQTLKFSQKERKIKG